MPPSQEFWDRVYERREPIVSRKIFDEMLLVPVRGQLADMERIFSLDPVAEHIWERLDGRRKMMEIRDSVLATFDVAGNQAERDIVEFIEELLAAGLIAEKE